MVDGSARPLRIVAGLIAAGAIALGSISYVAAARQPLAPEQVPAGQAPPAPAGGRVPPDPISFDDTAGWTSLFDGRSLQGWEGHHEVWRVEDGAITGESTPTRRVGTTYLVWSGGEPADFELKLEVRIVGSGLHSGIAYRSWIDPYLPPPTGARALLPPPQIPSDPKWNLSGYGLDFDYDTRFNGNVEERGTGRGEIAYRGGIVRAETGKRPRYIGTIGDPDLMASTIKPDQWTQLHIIARGNQLTHIINGQLMTMLIDDDPTFAKRAGRLGLQIDAVGKISFRNIWLKTL